MDEPTVGIDPQSRNKIFELITALHQGGKTILYTTHYMEEAERLCTKIGIIDKGSIIAEGTLAELKSNYRLQENIVITCADEDLPHIELNGFNVEHQAGSNTIQISSMHANRDLPEVIRQLSSIGISLNHIEIRQISLETIFLHLTGRQLRDN
jgi:ABC-2 type transport system ATP-binding protein